MSCCHYYADTDNGDNVFSVDMSAIKFGHGALAEIGFDALKLGMRRVALFTDSTVQALPAYSQIKDACRTAGLDVEVFNECRIEPTDTSFRQAIAFARDTDFDGFISLGGGSVIDTCKAANLYSSWPADFMAYVNAPLGEGEKVPGALKPHIACPTTSGTGSECTGIAVFDLETLRVKTGIAARELRPTQAVIDPTVTHSMPGNVVACTGFDVLCHALESFTALPHTLRTKPDSPSARPMSQGANPWSDLGSQEALRICGENIVAASQDQSNTEAREKMMFAAVLAGIAFGNAGVHVPHGMSYSVAGMIEDYTPSGYPDDHAMCPHGMSVIVNAPSAFRFTASASPERHLLGAELLGADTRGATPDDAGEILSCHLMKLMQATLMPNGISELGYTDGHVGKLAQGAIAQQRLLNNSPRPVNENDLQSLYRSAMNYW